MTKEQRLEKIKEGLSILKEAGIVAHFVGDDANIEIITENIAINCKDQKFVIREGDIELDLSEYVKVKSLVYLQGLPILNVTIFPEKFVLYPTNVKIRYGEDPRKVPEKPYRKVDVLGI